MLFQITKIQKRGENFCLKKTFAKVCFFVFLIFFFTACRTPQKVDMRSLAPNDAAVYLETDNLAAALDALAERPAFREIAADAPDFSALENIQLALIISGFESSESANGANDSVLNFKPKFVAVAETHLWNWQAVSLVENRIGDFVKDGFGENTTLETSAKENGKFYVWTAGGERKVFAFVAGSRIYFGNDAAILERALAVGRGEAESLSGNESLSHAATEKNLAFGYVSPEGVKQIADIAGVSAAVETTDEADGRNFIARVLPQILRGTTREIFWTARKTERGIEDKFSVALTAQAVSASKEILAASPQTSSKSFEFLTPDFSAATRYNLKSPLTSWRALLNLATKNTDEVRAILLTNFSDRLLEPYGVAGAETFLSSIDSDIITAQMDESGEKTVAVVTAKDAGNLKKSISKEINFQAAAAKSGDAEIWFSEDKQTAAAFIENHLLIGNAEAVGKCLQAKQSERSFVENQKFQNFFAAQSAAVTVGRDYDSARKIVEILSTVKPENRQTATFYSTETRPTERGFERVTVSEFGFIGTLVQLKSKN